MIFRHRYHWVELSFVFVSLGLALVCLLPHEDPIYFKVMLPLFLNTAIALFAGWATTYTSLKNGILTERIFFWTKSRFPVSEVESVAPHDLSGSGRYGFVVVITANSGERVAIQLREPEEFLERLRELSPRAEFRL